MSDDHIVNKSLKSVLSKILGDLIPILDKNENIYNSYPEVFQATPLVRIENGIPAEVMAWYEKKVQKKTQQEVENHQNLTITAESDAESTSSSSCSSSSSNSSKSSSSSNTCSSSNSSYSSSSSISS